MGKVVYLPLTIPVQKAMELASKNAQILNIPMREAGNAVMQMMDASRDVNRVALIRTHELRLAHRKERRQRAAKEKLLEAAKKLDW